MTEILPIPRQVMPAMPADKAHAARAASEQLEASFLAEMLKSAGFGEQSNTFSGSAGEEHFASFQRQALAEQMARNGGIGLAEAFYRAIMESEHDT